MAYHPQTNGRTERLNMTILTRIRSYVALHQKDWDALVQQLTPAYNAPVHHLTKNKYFTRFLSRHTPRPVLMKSVSALPTDNYVKTSLDVLQSRLVARDCTLQAKVDANMTATKQRYKQY